MHMFKKILCVVSQTPQADSAWSRAVSLAQDNSSQLTVASVVEKIPSGIIFPNLGMSADKLRQAMVDERQRQLLNLTGPFKDAIAVDTRVLVGTDFLEIIREVLRGGYDLVIRSVDENINPSEHLLGSDEMHLLRKCPCPVWLIKSREPKKYRRIIAAVDLDEDYGEARLAKCRALNQQVLEIASSMAISQNGELHIVYAWEAVAEDFLRYSRANIPRENIHAYVEAISEQHSVSLNNWMDLLAGMMGDEAYTLLEPKARLIKGNPRRAIPQYAQKINADMVVMGTISRSGVAGFFIGNTAESILNQLDCSVLAIKPPGFVTPVELQN